MRINLTKRFSKHSILYRSMTSEASQASQSSPVTIPSSNPDIVPNQIPISSTGNSSEEIETILQQTIILGPILATKYNIAEPVKNVEVTRPDFGNMSNITVDTLVPNNSSISPMEFHTKEAMIMDQIIKGIVHNLKILKDQGHVTLQESEKMTQVWKERVIDTDNIIKEYKKQNKWKFVAGASITIFSILSFCWMMYRTNSIPQFVNLLANIMPSVTNSLTSEPALPITMENTLKTIMETPFTALTICTLAGGILITTVSLKAIVWVLRKVPK